jgi:ribosomal-protein-alanine N-acetyltransferase
MRKFNKPVRGICKLERSLQKTFNLRLFKPSDLNYVIHINRVCLPENYSGFFFLDLYQRFPETFIVAEENGQVVGYIMCRIETSLANFGFSGIEKKGHVVSIAVLPKYQRRGIGLALMQKAMENMLRYKAKKCFLEVRVSNKPAIQMYKKLGFQIKRRIRSYYMDGEDAYVMERKLPYS